jgi:hypothetical protein
MNTRCHSFQLERIVLGGWIAFGMLGAVGCGAISTAKNSEGSLSHEMGAMRGIAGDRPLGTGLDDRAKSIERNLGFR